PPVRCAPSPICLRCRVPCESLVSSCCCAADAGDRSAPDHTFPSIQPERDGRKKKSGLSRSELRPVECGRGYAMERAVREGDTGLPQTASALLWSAGNQFRGRDFLVPDLARWSDEPEVMTESVSRSGALAPATRSAQLGQPG